MVVIEAIGLAARELFDYNREIFKFDQEQRLERDLQRVEMQIKRFDLFRQDIEDLVNLTVDKMDMYHLVGALFLGFTSLIYCEGLIMGPAFFLGVYLTSVAGAFVYLLLAVWLSMQASISSHSFGVRLRTRYVRLPIPSLSQISSLTAKLSDFEKQNVAKMFRLPMLQGAPQWHLPRDETGGPLPAPSSSAANPERPNLPEYTLGDKDEAGFLREGDLMKAAVLLPGKHIELFRQLQAKWQCYDAYARVSMALGVNQMIQSVNYFVIGVTMIERSCLSAAFAATIIYQTAAIAISILDISGLSLRTVVLIGTLGALPPAICLAMFTHANVNRRQDDFGLDPFDPAFWAAPAAFFAEVLWFQVILHVAHPSDNKASLPRKWRAVLFLDVFGDVAYDPTEAEHATADGLISSDGALEAEREAVEMQDATAEAALETTQAALRRWEACPQELLSPGQLQQLQWLRQEYMTYRRMFQGHRLQAKQKRGVPYDATARDQYELRAWFELSATEKQQDEFTEALIGPLESKKPASFMSLGRAPRTESYHYNLELGRNVFQADGQRVLTLQEVTSYVQHVKSTVENSILLEQRHHEPQQQEQSKPSASSSTSYLAGLKKSNKPTAERLPWKCLRRLTYVLQFCWFIIGLQLLLQDLNVPGMEILGLSDPKSLSRRLEADPEVLAWPNNFETMSMTWPHGAFFSPAALECGSSGAVWLKSRYSAYSLVDSTTAPSSLQALTGGRRERALAPVPSRVSSVDTVRFCPPFQEKCLQGSLTSGGRAVRVWPADADQEDLSKAVNLEIYGQPWKLLAGAVLPCANVSGFLPQKLQQAAGASSWCLLLVGWDGVQLPVAAVHLASATAPLAGEAVAPRLDIPLHPRRDRCQADDTRAFRALAMQSASGRLWGLTADGHLQAWDLTSLQPLGNWRPFHRRWIARGTDDEPYRIEARGVCESVDGGVWLTGVQADLSPVLLRASLPLSLGL